MPQHWTWGTIVVYFFSALAGKAAWDLIKWRYKIWRENRRWR